MIYILVYMYIESCIDNADWAFFGFCRCALRLFADSHKLTMTTTTIYRDE